MKASWVMVALAAVALGGAAARAGVLALRWGNVDTAGEEAVGERAGLVSRMAARARTERGKGRAAARGAYVVQFGEAVRAEWRDWLEGATQVRGYLPENAYLVWATAGEMSKIAAAEPVAWVGEWKREWSTADEGTRRALARAKGGDGGAVRGWIVESLLEGEAGAADLAGRLEALGGTVDEAFARFRGCAAAVRLTDVQVEAVSGWADVEWIEPRGAAAPCNDVAAGEGMLDVDPVRDTMGLDGAGQVIAVADTGLDIGRTNGIHPDFAGRVVGKGWSNGAYRSWAAWADAGGHGTHVAGSVAGSGAASEGQYRGMAPEARLVMQGMWTDFNGLPADLSSLLRQARSEGAWLHNDSWYYTTLAQGSYPSGASLVDGYMWTNQTFLMVVAAGNEAADADGDGVVDAGSVTPPGTAKNCLCVGAAEGPRTVGGYAEKTWGGKWPSDFPAEPIGSDRISGTLPQGLAAFSGRGPTSDGRFKPDVVAPGTDIVSARSRAASGTGWGVAANTNYMYYGGTSMATPLATGTLALMRQWLEEAMGVENPPAALLKALVVNGARDLSPGQHGTGAAREIAGCPDYGQGFGHVDLRRSIDPGTGRFLRWETGVLAASGEVATNLIAVGGAGAGPCTVTLAWQDAPAKPSASLMAVNDLDLTVTRPDGTLLYPNGLGESDRRNNIESLGFTADMAGIYTVRVRAYNIAVAAPNGGQPYALVVRGPDADGPAPAAARFSVEEVDEPAEPETAMEGVTFAAADYLVAGGIPAHGYGLVSAPGGLVEDEDYVFDPDSGGLLVLVPDEGTYRFEVAATNGAGTNTIAWNLTVAEGLPGAPSAVWVRESDTTELDICWQPVAGATGYLLDVARGTNFAKATDWPCAGMPVAGTGHRVEGLSPGTVYSIRLRAVDAVGPGPCSEAFCAATRPVVDEAAYASWLSGKGLAAEAYPQGATGANGAANWVNYFWDIAPTSTNVLAIAGVEVAGNGALLLQVPSASPARYYWLQSATNLVAMDPAEIYLGPGTPVMTNEPEPSADWFGRLRVRDAPQGE